MKPSPVYAKAYPSPPKVSSGPRFDYYCSVFRILVSIPLERGPEVGSWIRCVSMFSRAVLISVLVLKAVGCVSPSELDCIPQKAAPCVVLGCEAH